MTLFSDLRQLVKTKKREIILTPFRKSKYNIFSSFNQHAFNHFAGSQRCRVGVFESKFSQGQVFVILSHVAFKTALLVKRTNDKETPENSNAKRQRTDART